MIIKRLSIIFLSICLLFSSVLLMKIITRQKNNVYADTRTELVEAGIARAEFMYNYRWTPTQTLGGWGTTFYAGNEYSVPYSQPYYYGGYLFYNITLAQFEEYALYGTNNFYAYHDNNGNTTACPKYGIDCSGFVSFCIGSKTRYTTWTFKTNADSNSNGFYNKSFATAERGDILNCHISGGRQHVLLIKEVNGDYITTYESTPGYAYGNRDIWVRTQTKSQWAADGYNVIGHDYVTNCGGAPKDDITNNRSTGLPITTNTVLGSTKDNTASASWNKSQMYNTSSASFESRKVSITNFVGNDTIYFNQSNSTNLKVGATFTTTGKTTNELYGKFGIGFFNAEGKGLFTYVDAFGTSGTTTSNITGTNVGVVAKNPSNSAQWDWKTSTNYDIATNVYSSNSPIKMEIERNGATFDIYVNGNLVKTINGVNYYLSATEKIYPCVLTFNTCIEVTDYYSVGTIDSLAMDGNLDDWKALSKWDYIDQNKKTALDTASDKGAIFYYRWTDSGLFIYAQAKHEKDVTTMSDWWQNTNFEIMINEDSSETQYYAIASQVRGFESFYFKTSGTSGNYTSTLEAFIADCKTFENGINLGLSFRVRNYDNGIRDYITLSNGTQTDKWWAENLDPFTFPFAVTNEADVVVTPPSQDYPSQGPNTSSTTSSSSIVNSTTSNLSESMVESSNQTSSESLNSSSTESLSSSVVESLISSSTESLNSSTVESSDFSSISSIINSTESSSSKESDSTVSSDSQSSDSSIIQTSQATSTTENSTEDFSSINEENSDLGETTKGGCKGNIGSLVMVLPLALIAVVLISKKSRKNND